MGSKHILDEAMAIAFKTMRTLCGQKWLPSEVRFAHASPPELAPFRKFFRTPLRFDAHQTALVFARHWLDKAPAGADPLLNKMMAQRVNEMESHSSEDLVSMLSRMLPSLLEVHGASLAAIAKRVGLGERTLNRRLAAAPDQAPHAVDGGTGGGLYMLDAGEPAARLQKTARDRDTGRGFETLARAWVAERSQGRIVFLQPGST